MEVALFITFPVPSHYLSIFPFAHSLRQKGYRVIFTGQPQDIFIKEIVESEGFGFKPLCYATEHWIRSARIFLALLLKSLLDNQNTFRRYRDWYKSVSDVAILYNELRPAKIFIDEHLAHYYLYLFQYRQQCTIVNTKLSTKRARGIPPLNTAYIPDGGFLSGLVCELLWIKPIWGLRIQQGLQKIAYLLRDEVFFQKRLCKKYGVSWKDIFEYRNAFYVGLRSVPTIILAPESLNYPIEKKSTRSTNEYHLSLPVIRNEKYFVTPEYNDVKQKIMASRKRGCIVVYCAFGTISLIDYQRVHTFFKKLVPVFEQQKDWMLIIASGGITPDFCVPGNVHILSKVPQLDVLSICDVMICHGGLTSIKECLQAGIPMLVYPINKKSDPTGNAARVHARGFGIRGSIDNDSPMRIYNNIQRVVNERSGISKTISSSCQFTTAINLTISAG